MSPPNGNNLIFRHAVEAFLGQLGSTISEPMKDELARAGIDLRRPLDPAYPLATFDQMLVILLRGAFPDTAPGDALRQLGRLQVDAYLTTRLGWALFQLLRLLPRQRLLDRLTRSFRTANNFMSFTVEPVSPERYRVSVNEVGRFPESIQGVLEGALQHLAAARDGVGREVRRWSGDLSGRLRGLTR